MGSTSITSHGLPINGLASCLITLGLYGDLSAWHCLLFAGWALLGAFRAMRVELQFRNKPWPWIAFVVFLQIYCAGWINANAGQTTAAIPYLPTILIDTPVLRLLLATGIALSLAYLFLFAEPKDRSRFTLLIADWRAQRRSNVLEALPLWLINVVITVATAALTLLITVTRPDASTVIQIAAGTIAVLLYAVRDFTLELWCNLSGTQRRADAAAAVYLTVLYGVLPIIFRKYVLNETTGRQSCDCAP
jgi:hypothetical protein